MNTGSKTHYRKVYKSDHLGVADLEEYQENGSDLIFTITHVKSENGARVAGKKGDFNIAYFKENIKPLVLNATNAKTLHKLSGSSFVEDWSNINVQLRILNNIKFGGDLVDGVRISDKKPKSKAKYKLIPECDKWANAVSSTLELEDLRKHYDITDGDYLKLYDERHKDDVA